LLAIAGIVDQWRSSLITQWPGSGFGIAMQDIATCSSRPILVWGGGAIGGTVAGFLARHGREVDLVDVDRTHIDAISRGGLRITGRLGNFVARLTAKLPSEIEGTYSLVFLCVKADQTERAIADIVPALAGDGAIVSMQNGLCEHAIAQVAGAHRTVGAIINFGAYRTEPGEVVVGNPGTVVLGELDGAMTARLDGIVRLLRHFEPKANATANIWGFLWGKLAYSVLIKASALDDAPMVEFFTNPTRHRLHLSLIREVLAVARAEGITVEAFDGFDPRAFETGDDDAISCLNRMAGFFSASTKPQSTIWQDLVVLRRRTDAPAQLAPCIEAAAAHGLAVPVTRKLVELIRAVEDGRATTGGKLHDVLESAIGLKG
jgi:2-dehydropantoate 2-reductase